MIAAQLGTQGELPSTIGPNYYPTEEQREEWRSRDIAEVEETKRKILSGELKLPNGKLNRKARNPTDH